MVLEQKTVAIKPEGPADIPWAKALRLVFGDFKELPSRKANGISCGAEHAKGRIAGIRAPRNTPAHL